MLLMYVLASLPFVYVFSFIPKTAVMGFTNFFILNVIIIVIDAVAGSFPVFLGNDNPSAGPSGIYRVVELIRYIFALLLPSVNFKHTLANILVHNNDKCIRTSNSLLGTSLGVNESWLSTNKPGVGIQFIFFCVQTFFWFAILILIENRLRIRQARQRCCGSNDSEHNTEWNDQVRVPWTSFSKRDHLPLVAIRWRCSTRTTHRSRK